MKSKVHMKEEDVLLSNSTRNENEITDNEFTPGTDGYGSIEYQVTCLVHPQA